MAAGWRGEVERTGVSAVEGPNAFEPNAMQGCKHRVPRLQVRPNCQKMQRTTTTTEGEAENPYAMLEKSKGWPSLH